MINMMRRIFNSKYRHVKEFLDTAKPIYIDITCEDGTQLCAELVDGDFKTSIHIYDLVNGDTLRLVLKPKILWR